MILPDPTLEWPIDYDGVTLIAVQEGLRLKAYQCQAGVWTNGRGETEGVYPGQVIDVATADKWFLASLKHYTSEVMAMCSQYPNSNQLSAMVCLAYNIGLAGLRKSTVLRCHNLMDYQGASRAFGLYNKFRDPRTKQLTVSNGLVARRAAESALYLKPDNTDYPAKMPQAVQGESSLMASPIASGGAVTAAMGILATASSVGDQASGIVGQLKEWSDVLGLHPGVLLGGVLLVAGIVVMVYRYKQRQGGWA